MTSIIIDILEKQLQKAEAHLNACQDELLKALGNELHQMEGCVWPGYTWHWARPSDDIEKDIDQTKEQITKLKKELCDLYGTQVDGSFLDDLEIDLEF